MTSSLKKWRIWFVLTCMLAFVNATLAAEANQFELRAALAFDKAIDIAICSDRIIVLSPGTLTVLDASMLGPVVRSTGAISVGKDFVTLAADGDVVAMATRRGEIAIYQFDGAVLVHCADYSSADSVISMTMVGGVLCLAQGYDGVKIVDVSNPSRPRALQTLNEPDYSQEVDLAGEFLFVLDVLNGVTVYARSNGEYRHLDDILTDTPPTAISAHKSGVAIVYGTKQGEVWNCSIANGATLEWIVETEFPVKLICGSRTVDTMFFLGSNTGELSVVGRVTAVSAMPYPVDKIIAFAHSAWYSVVALDRVGNVAAFRSDPILASKITYDGATMPNSMVAVDDGLVVSAPTGIQLLTSAGSELDSRTIVPGAPITSILAESGQIIFAGSSRDGTVWSYVNERGRWGEEREIKTGLTLRKLFVRSASSDEQDLVAVGDEGIKCYRLETDGSVNVASSLVVNERINNAGLYDDWLATTSENGIVNLYAFVHGDILPVGERRCAARPRDVVVTQQGVVVVAHGGGIQVFEFDASNGELVELETPAAISSAFDLSYDGGSQELIVATGPTPVQYLDFSNPRQLGTVFLIAGTEGTSEITYRSGKLYCMSADWVRAYERNEGATEVPGSNATLQAVSAAPNPFNSDTQITIQLSPYAQLPLVFEVSFVNILGQTLAQRDFVAAEKSVVIDLPQVIGGETGLSSGVYFFVVRTAGETVTRKLLLLK